MRDMLRRARAREDAGLSLVEMVVALVVIGITLAALATALVAGMVAANTAEIRTRAVQLAAKYVEADQSVNWKFLGHRSTDIPAQQFYNGESLVRLGADVDASTVTDIPQSGPVSVSYAGTQFSVSTYVTWAGSSVSAPNNGSIYAAKKITIVITWAPRDGSHSLTTVAMRAPSRAEMAPPLNATTPISISSGTANPAQTLDATGKTSLPVVLTAVTTQAATNVVATYSLADGSQQQVALVGDAPMTTWAATVPVGTGPFAAGTLSITFTATAASGTQVTYAATLKLTAYVAPTLQLSSPAVVIGSGAPSDAVLQTGAGGYVTAKSMKVSVLTNTAPQSITASFPLSGGTQSTPVTLAWDGTAYSYTFAAGTGPLAAGNLIVTFTGTPAGGGTPVTTTASVTLTAPSLGAITVSAITAGSYAAPGTTPTWPWSNSICVNSKTSPATTYQAGPTLYIMVKNIASTDVVSLELTNISAGGAGPYTATYVKSDANGMTFKVALPSSLIIQSAATLNVKVNVWRAADATILSPSYTGSVALYWKNKASLC